MSVVGAVSLKVAAAAAAVAVFVVVVVVVCAAVVRSLERPAVRVPHQQ